MQKLYDPNLQKCSICGRSVNSGKSNPPTCIKHRFWLGDVYVLDMKTNRWSLEKRTLKQALKKYRKS